MVEENKRVEDFENMTDEDFLKLSEEDYSGNIPEGETSVTQEYSDEDYQQEIEEADEAATDESDTEPDVDTESSDGDPESDESDDDDDTSDEEFLSGEKDQEETDGTEPETGDDASGSEEQSETDKQDQENEQEEEEVDPQPKKGKLKLPNGVTMETVTNALKFYEILSQPIKADGREFQVRSPEDAIRLIQQGVNYSRRMQEIKPLRHLNRMLKDNGLDNKNSLNHLIDINKGNVEAITQLLKDHNIDPMDLDIDNHKGYQAYNYAGSTQDNEFRDALDNAISTPEGQALVTHINRDWDQESKNKLRENPQIVGNLTELKQMGVYDKVVEELNYQKSLGHFLNVPFLQAFDQVGEAMKNVGLFSDLIPQNQNPALQVNPQQDQMQLQSQHQPQMQPATQNPAQGQPIASGARKVRSPKKVTPNPHLSSTPPSKQSGNTNPVVDFDKMSDEEFLKMAPPS